MTCETKCEYAQDIGIPEHSCGNGCMYEKRDAREAAMQTGPTPLHESLRGFAAALRAGAMTLPDDAEMLAKKFDDARAEIAPPRPTPEPKTTPAMRARIKELATKGDDFDRAVLLLVDDFERLSDAVQSVR